MANADEKTFCICRDCARKQVHFNNQSLKRCTHCGSPRLLSHLELKSLSLAHLDCDAFFAAIEKRDNPDLIDKPLIIGGGRRGVVSTACYNARIYGVHSAQPMFQALALCPHATVLPPNIKKYSEVGKAIREEMRTLTPLVEPLSIDEAFLDLSGTEKLHSTFAAETLIHFVKHIEKTIGISLSVGLSYNKFLAKIASDLEKPRGFSIIGRAEALDFLKEKPAKMIWGVGKSFQAKLAKDGIKTIGQLQNMDETELAKSYGSMGLRLARLSRAQDTRNVTPISKAKSLSSEMTFDTNISNIDILRPKLRALSEKVSRQLKRKGLCGHTLVLKLKTGNFQIITRNRKLHDPTQLADKIYRNSLDLLKKECNGTPYRLIGIGVSDLYHETLSDPDDLIDEKATRRAHAERAIDKAREKFGADVIKMGLLFKSDNEVDQDL